MYVWALTGVSKPSNYKQVERKAASGPLQTADKPRLIEVGFFFLG